MTQRRILRLSLAILFALNLGFHPNHAEAAMTLPLWPEGPPSENGLTGPETRGGCVGNISQATLTVHLPPKDRATGAAVLITPGGGYKVVCTTSEGTEIAEALVRQGIAGIVLKYRLPNQHHTIPSTDARRAMRTVRHHAAEWGIDPKRLGICGFSAGGHLASTVSIAFDTGNSEATDPIEKQSCRPDFSILFYPVISMEAGVTHQGSRNNLLGDHPNDSLVRKYSNDLQVSADTPPTFLIHAQDDQVVLIENALRYYRQLVHHKVSARMVLFETGGHGPSAFKTNPSLGPILEDWLSKR